MNHEERLRFFDEELKGLWPQWEPTEAEIALWMGVLSGYAYDVARIALQQCVCEQTGNYRRPKPAPFLAKARVLSVRTYGSGRPHQPDVQTNVFIEVKFIRIHPVTAKRTQELVAGFYRYADK